MDNTMAHSQVHYENFFVLIFFFKIEFTTILGQGARPSEKITAERCYLYRVTRPVDFRPVKK